MLRLSSVMRDVRSGRHIVMVAAVVLLMALGGIVAIVFAGVSMNRDATRMQMQLVDNAISQGVVDALNGIQTVAFWDTTVRKLREGHVDTTWLDDEIGDYLTKIYGHDAMWILDPRDRVIYGYGPDGRLPLSSIDPFREDLRALVHIVRTGREDGRRLRDANFRQLQGRYTALSGGKQQGMWTSHIVEDRGEAVILSVMTVVPVNDQSLRRDRPYLMVSAVRIGEHQLRLFANRLLIGDLRAVPLSQPAKLSSTYVVMTDEGVPIQRFEWTARRPGHFLLNYVLPLFVLVISVAALLLIMTVLRMQRMTRTLVDKEKEASFLANYDPLSSLPNRRLFSQRLDAALAPGLSGPHSTMLAFCDVDNFKAINDTMGHELGDLLIKQVSRRLRAEFPDSVLVSRFGGDEFAIMNCDAQISVEEFGARIQRTLESPVDLGGKPMRIGISVGISIAPEHGRDATDLMRNADIALYSAKDAGRARSAIYHAGMHDELLLRKEREARLVAVMEAERFEVHYQPVVDIRASKVTGMEALLRWPPDDPAPMHPGEFIPIAESAGIMPKLGAWVITRAFTDSLRWPDLSISINLSPLQIKAPDLIEMLGRQLRATGADPRRIVLEVTEGLLLDSSEAVRETLRRLSAMGFRLALDDFGTGYSSLSYLQEFTFDKLKIDRSFICDGKLEDQRSAALVRAVIDVGRALNIEVVAEGVEKPMEALILKMLGCDQIQGWLYGRALPPLEATEHLKILAKLLTDAALAGPPPILRLASS